MPISCLPNDLIQAAACYKRIPQGMQAEVMIYLLQQLAGNTQTPDQLMESARCFRCIPSGAQNEVITYLLCQIATEVGA